VLAIDTALAACSVCLFDAERDKVIASESALLGRGHAEALLPMLERCIAKLDGGWTAVSRIGVVVGPGSFTGLRVGVAAARAAALATGRQSVGVTTLAALAAPLIAVSDGALVAAVIDARHGNVFLQLVSGEGVPLVQPVLVSLDEAADRIGQEPVHLVGSGAALLQVRLEARGGTVLSSAADALPDIVFVAKLTARADPASAPPEPLYVKAPDAKALAEQVPA
jgi:tRNA threonylcarbamoyl adenosine modification protein YeaZ